MTNKVLIGNSFSLSLIRKGQVTIVESAIAELKALVNAGAEVYSFWGHENTRNSAEKITGFSLLPSVSRPAVSLAPDGRPVLDGKVFDECWVLSPDYVQGYRPPIGTEVDESKIVGWKLLKLTWNTKEKQSNG